MIDFTKSNRFKTFRKKYRKDESVQELLDYMCVLENQIIELEKMVVALARKDAPQE